jgi:hypothetical protein
MKEALRVLFLFNGSIRAIRLTRGQWFARLFIRFWAIIGFYGSTNKNFDHGSGLSRVF